VTNRARKNKTRDSVKPAKTAAQPTGRPVRQLRQVLDRMASRLEFYQAVIDPERSSSNATTAIWPVKKYPGAELEQKQRAVVGALHLWTKVPDFNLDAGTYIVMLKNVPGGRQRMEFIDRTGRVAWDTVAVCGPRPNRPRVTKPVEFCFPWGCCRPKPPRR
jgi:hypothetical protein